MFVCLHLFNISTISTGPFSIAMLNYQRVLIYSMVHPRTSSHKISFEAELRVKGQMQLVLLTATKKKEEARAGRSIEQRGRVFGAQPLDILFFLGLMFCDSNFCSVLFWLRFFLMSFFFFCSFFWTLCLSIISFRFEIAQINSRSFSPGFRLCLMALEDPIFRHTHIGLKLA